MKEFQGKEEKVKHVLTRISNSKLKENSHLFPYYGPVPIRQAVEDCLKNGKEEDSYPAIILIRVVLAANRNYNKHVRKNLENIKAKYPNLKSFADLNNLLKSKSREEFYELWGHKNQKKYDTLKNLLKAAETLREKYGIQDDFRLMKKWAEDVNINKLQEDEIGKIMNVALATVQHLRMDLGIDTVKPDQRVLEVLEREFIQKKVSQKRAIQLVEKMSEISGIKTRTIDMILVNYGSGYYDNRKYHNRFMIQKEIAKRLKRLGVSDNIIAEATELSIEAVNEFK